MFRSRKRIAPSQLGRAPPSKRRFASAPSRRRRRRPRRAMRARKRVARRIPWAVSSRPSTVMRFKDTQQVSLTLTTQATGVATNIKMNDLDTAAPIGYTLLANFWNKYVVLYCTIKVTVLAHSLYTDYYPPMVGVWKAAYNTAASSVNRDVVLSQGKKLRLLSYGSSSSKGFTPNRPMVFRQSASIAKVQAETDITDDPLYEGQVSVSDPTNAPTFRILLFPDPNDATPTDVVQFLVERVFTVQLREPKQVIT